MEQAIYGDLYFAVNFTMDTLALYLTAKLLHLPPIRWRLAIGGAIGALYSVASLFLPNGNLLASATVLLMPCLICLAAFGWQNVSAFLREVVSFWAISLLLGGAMTAVCYGIGIWGQKQVSIGGRVEPIMGDLPFWRLLLFVLLAGALISLFLKRRKPVVKMVKVTVEDASSADIQALVDSGDLLTEPLSGLPVILVDQSKATEFLPDELRFLASPSGQHTPHTASLRLRLIPCTTASGEGILYGFIPKRVLVAGEPREACIAIGKLPKNADYTAIVPSNLL